MLTPIGFWSYSSSDDVHARGRLSQLRTLLKALLQQRIGRVPEVNIFQDVAAIPPGAEWEQQIHEGIKTSNFLIPIITPALLQSEWCCKEIMLFREREATILRRNDLIFPLHYISIDDLDASRPEDCHDAEVFRFLRSRQWIDFRKLRLKDPESEDVQRRLDDIAEGICAALRRVEKSRVTIDDVPPVMPPAGRPEPEPPPPPVGGLPPPPLAPKPPAPPIDLPPTSTTKGKEREASKELARANPGHHFVGALMLITGAFGVFAGFCFIFDQWYRPLALPGFRSGDLLFFLLPVCVIAIGFGTIGRRNWARFGVAICVAAAVLGAAVCVHSVLEVVTGRDSGVQLLADLWLGPYAGLLAAAGAAAAVFYIWGWRSDSRLANKLPHRPRDFAAFVLIFDIVTLAVSIGVLAVLFDGLPERPSFTAERVTVYLFLGLLIAGEAILSFYCITRFRKEFGFAAAGGGTLAAPSLARERRETPMSAGNPGHLFVGAYVLLSGALAFFLLFELSLWYIIYHNSSSLGFFTLLFPIGVLAIGLGTIFRQTWARFFGMALSLIAGFFFVAGGISAGINGDEPIFVGILLVVSSFCVAGAAAFYGWGWRADSRLANRIPSGTASFVAFLVFLLIVSSSLYIVGHLDTIQGPPSVGSVPSIPAVLVYPPVGLFIIVESLLAYYCVVRFRKEFALTSISYGRFQ